MLKIMKKSMGFLLIALIIMGSFVCSAQTVKESAQQNTDDSGVVSVDISDYEQYKENGDLKYADKEISVSLDKLTTKDTNATLKDGVINWADGKGSITFKLDLPEAAAYNLQIEWMPAESGINPTISVMLNGVYPFEAAKSLELKREWKNATEAPRTDSNGNEYAQEQVETGEFIKSILQDFTGVVTEPSDLKVTKQSP